MIDNYFPKTEGLLYRYMRQKASIERLTVELRRIEKAILDIENELGNLKRNFIIPEQSFAVNFGDVYTKTHSSHPERYIEKYGSELEKLEQKLTDMNKRRIHIKIKILNKEESIRAIDIIVSGMTDEEKQIVEMKYADKMSNYQIAVRLITSEATIRRKRAEIVEKIATDLGIKKMNLSQI